jgi:hypothetical protein
MRTSTTDPFTLTADELRSFIAADLPFLPELEAARSNIAALRAAPQTQVILPQTADMLKTIEQIPQTPYTLYRQFVRNGDRGLYEAPYFLKRLNLAAAALRLFFGESIDLTTVDLANRAGAAYGSSAAQASMSRQAAHNVPYTYKDIVQDYLWSICEESNWVLPAHEDRGIDLFAAETGFVLAETLALLGNTLDAEIRNRVRQEVEQRIFDPYIRFHRSYGWYRGSNNWNGVCNSSVAATFLLLEPEPGRVVRALEIALAGLKVFLHAAFESDGSSTEGVGYWHYGLINFVVLSEMLRARSGGALDLLASDHLRRVAAYPAKMQLSGPWFASFSDCEETSSFNPGIVARLAARTGEASLLNLLALPAAIRGDWRLTMMLRNILWWDGVQPERADVVDAVLPAGGTARLTAHAPEGAQVVLAIKAGHNDEHHNQNDVGSFIVHVDGETLLNDPGRGLYTRDYFNERRYENIFANSYGHSVPRIDGRLQGVGHEFAGQMVETTNDGPIKHVTVEFARAYPIAELKSLRRRLQLSSDGVIVLRDDAQFTGGPLEVEEALITWREVAVDGATALVQGERHALRLTIESPPGAQFHLERLEEASQANAKPAVLKRLSFVLPAGQSQSAQVRMEVTALRDER